MGEDLQGDAVAVYQKHLTAVHPEYLRSCVHGLKNDFLGISVSMLGALGLSVTGVSHEPCVRAAGPLAQLVRARCL